MAALIRYGLRKSHKLGHQLLTRSPLHRCRQSQLNLQLVESTRCLAAVHVNKGDLRPKIYSRLDHNKGITTELFNDLLSSLEKQGFATEQDVNLLLHICSSGITGVSLSSRAQYADHVWSKFAEPSLQPTSRLYNMKLKAYVSNDKKFSPLDELERMKSLGINPDKVTYGLLIEGFCRNGDISGANHVLEAMNDAQLVIEISVFNSFITGHLRAGSPDEALQILQQLRSRGLSPNSDTYYRFIKHYAEEGDGNSVQQFISEAHNAGFPIDQNALMKAYTLMLRAGHEDQANQILPMIEKDLFNFGTLNNLCQLVAEGFHNEALNMYLNIPMMTDIVPNKGGVFLLQCMVSNDQDAKDIVSTADRLCEAFPQTNPYNRALFFAYREKKFELGVQILEEMMSKKENVRLTHILPALCSYRDAGNMEGVYKTVAMILSLDPSEETAEAMENFCYPALKQIGQSKEDIVIKMKEHESKWNTFFMLTELKTNGCDAALESVSNKLLNDAFVNSMITKEVLANRLPEQRESRVKLLVKLVKEYNLDKRVIVNLLAKRLNIDDLETVHCMLDVCKQEGVRLPAWFMRHTSMNSAPQDIKDKVKELCTGQSISRLSFEELNAKTREDLEVFVKKFPRNYLAHFVLLNKAQVMKDLSDVQKKLKEMKAMNFTLPRIHLSNIISTLSKLGDVEGASVYFKEFNERFGHRYRDTIPLSLAVLYVQAGNIEDAVKMIDAAQKSESKTLSDNGRLRRKLTLNLIYEAKTMADVEPLHEALVKGKNYLLGVDAALVHHSYINKALDSDDDDEELLQRLTELRDRYWVFPCIDKVLMRCIKKQDIDYLKKVMDIAVSVIGNNVFQHKLAFSFISCGMPSKATAVFKKMSDNIYPRILESNCKYFIKNNEVEHIETLVEVLKDLPVSRTFLLKQLIEAYVTKGAVDKAIDILQIHDNEFLSPHKSALDILETHYKTHKMEQPEILKAFLLKRINIDESRRQGSDSSFSPSELRSDSDKGETRQ